MRSSKITIVVVICAVVITTLGISAADMFVTNTQLANVFTSSDGCDSDAVPVSVREGTVCVDKYEASPAADCPHLAPQTVFESQKNIDTVDCKAVSVEENDPWRFVSQTQAAQACALSGKKLLNNKEWYRAALGTVADNCVINSSGVKNSETCVSGSGAFNMIGNVWEWTDEMVKDRIYNDDELPPSGYVSGVDADGVVLVTENDPQVLYGDDYYWSPESGVTGMVRGGFYGSDSDAGLYALNASVALDFTSAGVGFRCGVKL